MRDHGMVCVRFNPHQPNIKDAGLALVNNVWKRSISPDFSAFREKHRLA
jgi:hypothetical protein